MYKETYLNKANHNSPLPNIVVSLSKDFEDIFPKKMPKGLPQIKGTEQQHDFSCDEYNVNSPFNVHDLFPFDIGDEIRGRIFLKKEGMMGTIVQVMGTTMQVIKTTTQEI